MSNANTNVNNIELAKLEHPQVKCDLCHKAQAVHDSRLLYRTQWAYMCVDCFIHNSDPCFHLIGFIHTTRGWMQYSKFNA